jgi:hypothetical protein
MLYVREEITARSAEHGRQIQISGWMPDLNLPPVFSNSGLICA